MGRHVMHQGGRCKDRGRFRAQRRKTNSQEACLEEEAASELG